MDGFEIPSRYDVDWESLEWNAGNSEGRMSCEFLTDDFEGLHYELTVPGGMGVPATYRAIEPRVPRRGLLLLGNVGTGKTTLLGAFAGRLLDKGVRIAWATYAELLDRLADNDPKRREMADALARVPALFVDEVGQGKKPDFIRERFLSLIGKRYDNELSLFATTNLSEAELSEALGIALRSRLKEMTVEVAVTGVDRRQSDGPRPGRRVPKVDGDDLLDEQRAYLVGPDDPYVKALIQVLADKTTGKLGRAEFADRIESLASVEGVLDERASKGLALLRKDRHES